MIRGVDSSRLRHGRKGPLGPNDQDVKLGCVAFEFTSTAPHLTLERFSHLPCTAACPIPADQGPVWPRFRTLLSTSLRTFEPATKAEVSAQRASTLQVKVAPAGATRNQAGKLPAPQDLSVNRSVLQHATVTEQVGATVHSDVVAALDPRRLGVEIPTVPPVGMP
jgi:hypothetical protein